MDAACKQKWLHVAETIDSLRVFPRLVLAGYFLFVYHVTNYLMVWYTHEPPGARGVEESGTVAAIFATVTGLLPWVYRIYSDGARDWNAKPDATTSTTTMTSTTSTPP
jgi:hypothetical protein